MNSSKKIIDTLRSADKASVEKLMDEAARKEDIFARIQERTGAQNSDYTDVEAGVEKYGRRISITRMVSAAAAIAVLAGAVGGGVYLMRRPNPTDDDLNITNTTDGQLTTDESIPAELTKDFLYDRVGNYEDHYRRFSCDYEITDNSEGIIPFTVSGSVCVDKDGDKGWCSSERVYHGNDVKLSENTRIIEYYCGGYDVHAQGNWADDSGSELTGKEYTMSYARHDSVYLPISPVDCGSLSERIGDKESWEITGDRTENGRRISNPRKIPISPPKKETSAASFSTTPARHLREIPSIRRTANSRLRSLTLIVNTSSRMMTTSTHTAAIRMPVTEEIPARLSETPEIISFVRIARTFFTCRLMSLTTSSAENPSAGLMSTHETAFSGFSF